MDEAKELNELLKIIPIDPENKQIIDDINQNIKNGDYDIALERLQKYLEKKDQIEEEQEEIKPEELPVEEDDDYYEEKIDDNKEYYPEELRRPDLEKDFIGMLLTDPKLIAKYYVIHDECYFENKIYLEIYKGILFTEGEAYAPYIAKNNFNFGMSTYTINRTKASLKREYQNKNVNMEKYMLS